MTKLRVTPSATRMEASQTPMALDSLSLAEVISALSFAVDLTEGAVPGHAVRSCILGMRIGDEAGLPPHVRTHLYYALLLKDTGCSNNAARMCQIVGGNDVVVKNAAKLQDWTKPHKPSLATLRMLWQEVLPAAKPLARLGRILHIALGQHKNNAEMITLRCERGAEIARKLGMSDETAEAIHSLDEHWDGSGYPSGLKHDSIPLLARIMAIAQHLDVFASERSPEEALRVMTERSGTWFDPSLVRSTLALARDGSLWTGSLPTDDADLARTQVVQLQPMTGQANGHTGVDAAMSGAYIDRVCEAFADVVDAKSPFTYRHSLGVADVAYSLAAALALPPARCTLVRRAALLHDLGKLAIPNTILDKRSALTEAEWRIVVEHPRLSREILDRIHPFAEIAAIAGAHHERLDGSGYPDHLTGDQLSIEARVIAVADFYSALTEDRPYRAGMPHPAAMAILREQAGALDSVCVDALDRAHLLMKKTSASTPRPTALAYA